MRNLIIFLRRYFNFFLFLVIEIVCLALVFRNNDYQKAAFLNSSNKVSALIYKRYNDLQYYFQLKATNDSLVKENIRLRSLLKSNFDWPDSGVLQKVDTIAHRKYEYMPAKVVNNSVNTLTNYITIHRGSLQGVKPNMAVIGPSGVVGVVRYVNDNFSVVMSLLHKKSSVYAKLSRTGEAGPVIWEGEDPLHATLKNIPKSANVQKGDSVVTSAYSSIFPENILVGYVDKVMVDKASNFYTIRIQLATNFFNLQYVYVVKNNMLKEQQQVESQIPKNE